MRRAQSFQTASHADDQDRAWEEDDSVDEIARMVDADLRAKLSDRPYPPENGQHGLNGQLEAEFDRRYGSMDPVDFDADGTGAQRNAYADAWDDDALDAYQSELISYTETEPDRFDQGFLPPHAQEDGYAAPAPRRRFALMAAAGLVVVAGVGFGVWTLGGGVPGFGEPQLVKAPDGPYKIIPEASDRTETANAAPVFSPREATPEKGEDRLVARSETVPDLPGVEVPANRVILPNGEEVDPEPELMDSGPRRVRTVLVKPDGTIINAPDGAPRTLAAERDPAPVPGEPEADGDPMTTAGILPTEADPIGALASGGPSTSVATENAGEALLPPLKSQGTVTPVTVTPVTVAPAAEAPAAAAPVAEAPVAEAAPAAAPVPVRRPAAPPAAPIQVASAEPQATAPAPAAASPAAAGGSAAFVQVSSQRSEDAAVSAFQSLQRKFPALLSGVTPDVQRADLGAKGIYYRARIGAPSRDAAVRLCEQLKAAGGDCLIAKN